ncbi:MAG: hypothetical protein JRF63_01420 [Deltaproteobacteria bacterium]|nr:hypothetical protein [Deltaproteobacteria bacterium]
MRDGFWRRLDACGLHHLFVRFGNSGLLGGHRGRVERQQIEALLEPLAVSSQTTQVGEGGDRDRHSGNRGAAQDHNDHHSNGFVHVCSLPVPAVGRAL